MRTSAALAAAPLLASAIAATPAQAKVNQWHGCKLTARAEALDNEEIPGAPAFGKGSR